MTKDGKVGKGGTAVVLELSKKHTLSLQITPAGPRAHLNEDGNTRSVDPRAFGVLSTEQSTVGGGNPRITIQTTQGTSVDFTKRDDGTTDTVEHEHGSSRTRQK